MSSDLPRSKRFRADSALALASGIALPSRASAAIPTLTYTNSNTNTNSEGQDQLGLFHDDQWQDVFIPVSVGQAPLTSADVNPVASRKRRKIIS
jgi:hypothetical protein